VFNCRLLGGTAGPLSNIYYLVCFVGVGEFGGILGY
jgi:hypothetical protein